MAEESNQESKNNSSNVLLELFKKIEAGNSKILEKFQEFSESSTIKIYLLILTTLLKILI